MDRYENYKVGGGIVKNKLAYKVILALGFFMGIIILLYPLASQIYYDLMTKNDIKTFQELVERFEPIELKSHKLELTEAYNEALEPELVWEDPYSDEERLEGIKEYAKMLEVRDRIGIVNIPKINLSLIIYAGTNDSVLKKGVGHLEGSSLPIGGINTHSVITAHSGLPEARLFTDLDKLEIGDIFSIETLAGEIFYEVDEIVVVEPTNIDKMRIIKGKDYVTLLTCTPYMVNSHRLLVRGERIPAPDEEILEELDRENQFLFYLKTYWYYLVLILLVISSVFIILKRTE